MSNRGGNVLIGVVVAAGALSGCASTPAAAPTSTTASTSSPAPSATAAASADVVEAQQRAETWLQTTPAPPGATRYEESPDPRFANSYQGWVCAPTVTETGYWSVDGLSLNDALNWMRENPTPGLTPRIPASFSVPDASDSVTMGVTPSPESQEGIVLTFIKTPSGTAIRAEVGAMTASATCPPPPGGGEWGHPGEG